MKTGRDFDEHEEVHGGTRNRKNMQEQKKNTFASSLAPVSRA
jgi:hypothetical protein